MRRVNGNGYTCFDRSQPFFAVRSAKCGWRNNCETTGTVHSGETQPEFRRTRWALLVCSFHEPRAGGGRSFSRRRIPVLEAEGMQGLDGRAPRKAGVMVEVLKMHPARITLSIECRLTIM